jgi:hypothetical protein
MKYLEYQWIIVIDNECIIITNWKVQAHAGAGYNKDTTFSGNDRN